MDSNVRCEWMVLWTILLLAWSAAVFVGGVFPVLGAWWLVSSAAAYVFRTVKGVIGGAGRRLSEAAPRGVFAFDRVERRLSDRSGKCKVGRCRLTL